MKFLNIFKKEHECPEPIIDDILDDNIKKHLAGLEEKSNLRLQKITKTLDLVEQLTDDAKKDQDILRFERDVWKATFNAIPNLIMILDSNRTIARVNKSFLNQIGSLEDDLIGKSCSEVLNHTFCDCENKCYIDGNIKIDFKTCSFNGKFFTISYVPILNELKQIDGHIIQYQDITDQIEKLSMLSRRDSIINAINISTEKMLKDTTAQNGFRIEQMISLLGKAAQVSRVSVYQNTKDNNEKILSNQKYEWCYDNVKSEQKNPLMHNIDLNAIFPRWVNSLKKGESIYGHIDDFPDSEKQFFDSFGVRSTLVVPIFVSDEWTGFMRIDHNVIERVWQDPEINAFQMAANVLGAWIERGKVEQELREMIKNSSPNKKKLGEYILEEGLLSREQLDDVLKKQETEEDKPSSYKYVCINLTN